jgi:hypothetical protein
VIKLKDILLERESDIHKIFGNFAFVDPNQFEPPLGQRWASAMGDLQNTHSTEPNTDDEREILFALFRWLSGSSDLSANELAKYETILKKAKKRYPEVFDTNLPPNTPIYRGLRRTHASKFDIELEKTKPEDWTRDVTDPKLFVYKKKIKYAPNRPIQSWTIDSEVARTWFTNEDRMILISTIDNNFYLNPNSIEIIYQGEQEIIHFGKTYRKPINLAISITKYVNLFTPADMDKFDFLKSLQPEYYNKQ